MENWDYIRIAGIECYVADLCGIIKDNLVPHKFAKNLSRAKFILKVFQTIGVKQDLQAMLNDAIRNASDPGVVSNFMSDYTTFSNTQFTGICNYRRENKVTIVPKTGENLRMVKVAIEAGFTSVINAKTVTMKYSDIFLEVIKVLRAIRNEMFKHPKLTDALMNDHIILVLKGGTVTMMNLWKMIEEVHATSVRDELMDELLTLFKSGSDTDTAIAINPDLPDETYHELRNSVTELVGVVLREYSCNIHEFPGLQKFIDNLQTIQIDTLDLYGKAVPKHNRVIEIFTDHVKVTSEYTKSQVYTTYNDIDTDDVHFRLHRLKFGFDVYNKHSRRICSVGAEVLDVSIGDSKKGHKERHDYVLAALYARDIKVVDNNVVIL